MPFWHCQNNRTTNQQLVQFKAGCNPQKAESAKGNEIVKGSPIKTTGIPRGLHMPERGCAFCGVTSEAAHSVGEIYFYKIF